jgi:hypothetical protein
MVENRVRHSTHRDGNPAPSCESRHRHGSSRGLRAARPTACPPDSGRAPILPRSGWDACERWQRPRSRRRWEAVSSQAPPALRPGRAAPKVLLSLCSCKSTHPPRAVELVRQGANLSKHAPAPVVLRDRPGAPRWLVPASSLGGNCDCARSNEQLAGGSVIEPLSQPIASCRREQPGSRRSPSRDVPASCRAGVPEILHLPTPPPGSKECGSLPHHHSGGAAPGPLSFRAVPPFSLLPRTPFRYPPCTLQRIPSPEAPPRART